MKAFYPKSGVWFPIRQRFEFQCCDCGLVHNMWYRLGKWANLEMKITRNVKETLKVRKKI